MKLLDKHQILNNLSSYDWEDCYLYFLFEGNEIVYIGTTHHIGNRIKFHRKTKNFDIIKALKINSKEAYKLETEYINYYKPVYNFQVPEKRKQIDRGVNPGGVNPDYKTHKKVSEEFAVNFLELEKDYF